MVARNPGKWTQLIRPDGVHLTLAGNQVFGATLADIVFSIIRKNTIASDDDQNAAAWLEKALDNPKFIECHGLLSKGQPLDAITEGQDTARLMLQQCRSLARRAGVLAADARVAREALITERLAAGLLAWMRMRSPHVDSSFILDNVAWARHQLGAVCDHPPASSLLQRFEGEARKLDR